MADPALVCTRCPEPEVHCLQADHAGPQVISEALVGGGGGGVIKELKKVYINISINTGPGICNYVCDLLVTNSI